MNLTTDHPGLHLRSPIIPSASPLTENLDNVKRMEDAGGAALVFHSFFAEQLFHGQRDFFSQLRRANASVQVPIIASLNGHTEASWIDFAKQIQQTGVDVLELNIYSVPCDPNENSVEIETNIFGSFLAVKAAVQIPVLRSPLFN